MQRKFKTIGENVSVYDPVAIMKPEMISLGSHIIISEFAYINGGLGIYVGNNVHIAAQTCISGGGYCILDDFSGISAGVKLITGSAIFDGTGLTSPTLPREFQSVKRSYVIIKKHATLATNVVVHPGVTIGEGCIVASGSVVTKDTEPWSIYMGTPAKKVKDRSSDKIIDLAKQVSKKMNLTDSNFDDLIQKIAHDEATSS